MVKRKPIGFTGMKMEIKKLTADRQNFL
jgi:hypothetical protein